MICQAQAYSSLYRCGMTSTLVLALYLASDESRNINGAIIPADAGWAAV
jgi:hypothetical protein